MHRSWTVLSCCAVAIAALVGCGGSDLVLPGGGTPAELSLVAGNNQAGEAGSPLRDSLEVLVKDDRGDPLPGQTVTFALDSDAPGARVTPETTTTRADGTARALWVLGATSGTQRVVARVARAGAEPLEVQFNATVGAAPPGVIAASAGNEQSGPAGTRLADPVVVLVTDGFGNPVPGVTVNWAADGGSVDPGSSVTSSDGLAQTAWTLGPSTGTQTLTASSEGLSGSPVTFTATALAGNPDRLVLISGNNQTAPAGTELPNPLVVQLLDEDGNGVPNRAVTWVVATGGGTVSSATSTTDADGRASTRWTLGNSPGPNTLNAVVSGIGTGVVAFSATATGPGGGGSGASRLVFRVQPSDTEEGSTMTPAVEVAVLDGSGNVVTSGSFDIKLELLDRRGDVRADGTAATRAGVATFTIRIDTRGEYRLRASTDGLPSVESDEFEIEKD